MANGRVIKSMFSAIDRFVKGYIVVQSDHSYIHDGIGFTAISALGSISSATYIGFETPTVASGKFIHWRPTGLTSSANYVQVTLYEGDTYTGGTSVAPINRNRNLSTNHVSDMQEYKYGVTSSPSGTIIENFGVGSTGSPNARSGGAGSSNEELVLKPNTKYVMKLDPAGATTVTVKDFWYEEASGI